MKTFKNTKTGEILEQNLVGFFQDKDGNTIPARFVEGSCDWEEVIKDYRIVSVKIDSADTILTFNHEGVCIGRTDGVNPSVTFDLDKVLVSKHSIIHSVERLSDGEIFTVNDRVAATDNIFTDNDWYKNTLSEVKSGTWAKDFDDTTITGFKVVEGRMCAIYAAMGGDCGQPIEFVKKAEEPLLTTKDGIALFRGDSYYFIWTKIPAKGQKIYTVYSVSSLSLDSCETFSSDAVFFADKDNADEFVKEHSIFNDKHLSLNDLLEVWGDKDSKALYAQSPLFKNFENLVREKLAQDKK